MRTQAIAIFGFAILFMFGAPLTAQAQQRATSHAARPRIEVAPGRLLYRRCEAWYVLQNRPSGTVLFPEKHCWWVRG